MTYCAYKLTKEYYKNIDLFLKRYPQFKLTVENEEESWLSTPITLPADGYLFAGNVRNLEFIYRKSSVEYRKKMEDAGYIFERDDEEDLYRLVVTPEVTKELSKASIHIALEEIFEGRLFIAREWNSWHDDIMAFQDAGQMELIKDMLDNNVIKKVYIVKDELSDVFRKYGVITDGLERKYMIEFGDRKLDMDSVTPISLSFTSNDNEKRLIEDRSWTKLLHKLAILLNDINPIEDDKLLSFELDWSSALPFRKTKDIANMVKLSDNLYLSVNHSANHSCWLVWELLKLYGINNGTLLVHRPPFSEPVEVVKAVKKQRKSEFHSYLIETKEFDSEIARKIVNTIDNVLNRLLINVNETRNSYYDFYLFDNVTVLSNYKSKCLSSALYITNWDDRKMATARKYLDYLTGYYTTLMRKAKWYKRWYERETKKDKEINDDNE